MTERQVDKKKTNREGTEKEKEDEELKEELILRHLFLMTADELAMQISCEHLELLLPI